MIFQIILDLEKCLVLFMNTIVSCLHIQGAKSRVAEEALQGQARAWGLTSAAEDSGT